MEVSSPLGDSIRVYAGYGKAKQDAKEERLSKRLMSFLTAELAADGVRRDIRWTRKTKSVSVNWQTLVRVSCPTADSFWLEWEFGASDKLGFSDAQKAAWSQKFREQTEDGPATLAGGRWQRL